MSINLKGEELKGMWVVRRVILLVGIMLFAVIAGLGYKALHSSPAPATSNPLVDARIQFENALLDRHIARILPETLFWVSGELPNCTVLRVGGLVVKNGTYLAVFYPTEGELTLVPANKSAVNEYLRFFDEHGGRIIDCKSTVTVRYNTTTLKVLNDTCVIPAIIRVDENGTEGCCG